MQASGHPHAQAALFQAARSLLLIEQAASRCLGRSGRFRLENDLLHVSGIEPRFFSVAIRKHTYEYSTLKIKCSLI